MEEFIIQILVKKITSGEINPKTNEAFKVQDILKVGYREEVRKRIEVI